MTPPAPDKKTTMKDVAEAAGCDPSTVSLALRGDPRITAETRERVEAAARSLGYAVHPLVAAWVSARRRGRAVSQRLPLAYLTCHPGDFRWRASEHFRAIFEGARDQAAGGGFNLTEFCLADYTGNFDRLFQVLVTRNVQGVIIGPTLQHHALPDWDWSRFSLVTIGYGLASPAVHRVTEDHHLGMKLAFEACLARGHRRIGLAIVRKHNALRRERWLAAYLFEQYNRLSAGDRLVPYEARPNAALAEALAWVKAQRPDVVLTDDPEAWRETSVNRLGFALAAAYQHSGVFENNRGIGARAAELLVALIMRNERGVPKSRQTVLVEPTWLDPAEEAPSE